MPYADGNVVLYLEGRTDVRVLFSSEDVGQLLALHEVADDLTTISFTHPDFEPRRLSLLRERVAALGLGAANVSFSRDELKHMKTDAAARVIERALRERGIGLSSSLPLLTSGPFTPTHSPKLTAAFKDPSVLEEIVRSNDPNLIRAVIYLVRLDVIELETGSTPSLRTETPA
jgi:hypothetical protein